MGILGKVARERFTLYHTRWVSGTELQDHGLHCTTQDGCLGQSYKTTVYTVPHKVGVWGRVTRPGFTLYHTRWVSGAELQDQGLHCTTQGGCLGQIYKTRVYTVPHKMGVWGRVTRPGFTLYHTRCVSGAELQDQGLHCTTQCGCLGQSCTVNSLVIVYPFTVFTSFYRVFQYSENSKYKMHNSWLVHHTLSANA